MLSTHHDMLIPTVTTHHDKRAMSLEYMVVRDHQNQNLYLTEMNIWHANKSSTLSSLDLDPTW